MVRSLLLIAALGASTSAWAQDATPPAAESPAQAVARIVDTEFPAYDANDDDQLDKAEFTRWMSALKDQEIKATGATMTPEQIGAWIDGAYKTADTDKSGTINKPELIAYLGGGAS